MSSPILDSENIPPSSSQFESKLNSPNDVTEKNTINKRKGIEG